MMMIIIIIIIIINNSIHIFFSFVSWKLIWIKAPIT